MRLIQTIKGTISKAPPLWMMRQAGRYLPGYRALRQNYPDFISMCLDPNVVVPITLEPLEYFDLDAAIIFSDILMVPYALGQKVSFDVGYGPRLGPLPHLESKFDTTVIAPVLDSIAQVRSKLAVDKALIGFVGAPWTLLSYMIEGQGTKTYEKVKTFVYQHPDFDAWMDKLVQTLIVYLLAQRRAGVDVVMLFDSWAGHVPYDLLDVCCFKPLRKIVAALHLQDPELPVICFPRQVAMQDLEKVITKVKPSVLALSNGYSPYEYAKTFSDSQVVQLGPDPVALKVGGPVLDRAIDDVLQAFAGRPYIMNLAHGVLPETPLAHVHHFINRVQGFMS